MEAKKYAKLNANSYKDPKRNYAIIPFYEKSSVFARTKVKNIKDLRGRSWRIPNDDKVNEKNFENIQKYLHMVEVERHRLTNTAQTLRFKIWETQDLLFEQKALSKKASFYQSLMGFFLGTTIGSFLVLYSFGVGWL